MRCIHCGREMTEGKTINLVCPGCGEMQQGKHDDSMIDQTVRAVVEDLKRINPELFQQMHEAARVAREQGMTEEEFIDRIMQSVCPKCGSEEVDDCEEDPDIDDITIMVCHDCGHHYCCNCCEPIDLKNPECTCWDDEGPGELDMDSDFDDRAALPEPSFDCCLCSNELEDDAICWSVGGRFKRSINRPPLTERDHNMLVGMPEPSDATKMRTYETIVLGFKSPLRVDGFELIYPLCSETCYKTFMKIAALNDFMLEDLRRVR